MTSPADSTISGSSFAHHMHLETNQPDRAQKGDALYVGTTQCDDKAARTGAATNAADPAAGSLARARADESVAPVGADGIDG